MELPFKSFLPLMLISGVSYGQVFGLQDDLFEISLQDLMNIQVVTATGSAQGADEAPAIVSVINSTMLNSWGVNSVGEALSKLPGLYCQYDYISYNCGVRGINGGDRGQSKVMKVMINGQVISFRSDTNNYLGPELIPITAIERIEVVRGPSSALYGANAFLGVVNVITKKGQAHSNKLYSHVQSMDGKMGTQQAVSIFNELNGFNYHVSAQYTQSDRSGLTLPDEFPGLSSIPAGSQSVKDMASSKVIYSGVSKGFAGLLNGSDALNVTLDFHYTNLLSDAQWHDYGSFSQSTANLGVDQTIGLTNQFWRLSANYQYSNSLAFKASIAQSEGSPSSDEVLDVGAESFIPKREFGFEAQDLVLEAIWSVVKGHDLTLGMDKTDDTENLYEVYRISKTDGEVTLATNAAGDVAFSDEAYYLQYTGALKTGLELTLNARFDNHSIYGDDSSYRAGLYYRINDRLSTKLLAGTSYKAPAATQLYAQPLFSGEVNGNDQLTTETADTIELQMNWRPNSHAKYSFTVFNTKVKDKIEVIATQAENVGQTDTTGFEAELQVVKKRLSITGNMSFQQTDAITQNVIGETQAANGALYPKLISNLLLDYKLSDQINLNGQYQYVSERRASFSNVALNSNEPYQLSEYTLLNLSMNYHIDDFTVQVKVNNALDEEYEYTGFGGIDIPGLPRTIILGGSYEF